jgi:N-acetylneuraminic acid mutarotase
MPRSEMAWATAHEGRMHIVGGYAEQRVDRPYHHVYEAAADAWVDAAPLPLGANHVGVAFLDGKLYAIGGFLEQNRKPHPRGFVYDPKPDRWSELPPLPRPVGSAAVVGLPACCMSSAAPSARPPRASARSTGTWSTTPRPSAGASAIRCRRRATTPARL